MRDRFEALVPSPFPGTLMQFLLGITAGLLTGGTLCLLRWLPLRLRRIVLPEASDQFTKRACWLGSIGTASYLCQLTLLFLFLYPPIVDQIATQTLLVMLLLMLAVLIPAALFAIAVLNFVTTVLRRIRLADSRSRMR